MSDPVILNNTMRLDEIKQAIGYETDSAGDSVGKRTFKQLKSAFRGRFGVREIKLVVQNEDPNKPDNAETALFSLLKRALGPYNDFAAREVYQKIIGSKPSNTRLTDRTMRQLIRNTESLRGQIRAQNSRRVIDFIDPANNDWRDVVTEAGWSADAVNDKALRNIVLAAVKRSPRFNAPLAPAQLKNLVLTALRDHKAGVELGLSEAFPSLAEDFPVSVTSLDRRDALNTYLGTIKNTLTGEQGTLAGTSQEAKNTVNQTLELFKKISRELGRTEYEPSKLKEQRNRLNDLTRRLQDQQDALQRLNPTAENNPELQKITTTLQEDLNSLNGRLQFKTMEIEERLRDDPDSMRSLWQLRHDVALGAYYAGMEKVDEITDKLQALWDKKIELQSNLQESANQPENNTNTQLQNKVDDLDEDISALTTNLEEFKTQLEAFKTSEQDAFNRLPVGFRSTDNTSEYPEQQADLDQLLQDKPLPGKDITVKELFDPSKRNEKNALHAHKAFGHSWGRDSINKMLEDADLVKYGLVSKGDVKASWIKALNAPENAPVSKQAFTVELGGIESQYELIETPMSRSNTRNARKMNNLGLGQRSTKDRKITPQEKASLQQDDRFVAPINTRTANLWRVTYDKNGNPKREKAMEIHHHAINDFYKLKGNTRDQANTAAATAILTEAMANDQDWLQNVHANPGENDELIFVNINYTNPRLIGDADNLEKTFTANQVEAFNAAAVQESFTVDVNGQQDQQVEVNATYLEFQFPTKLEEDTPGSRKAVYQNNQAILQQLVGGLDSGDPIDGKIGATVRKLEQTVQNNDPDTSEHQRAQQLLAALRQTVNQTREILTNHDYLSRSSNSYLADRQQAGRHVAVMVNLWREATELVEADDRRTRVAYGDNCKSTKDRGPMGAAAAMAGKIIIDHGQAMQPGSPGGMSNEQQQEVLTTLAATVGRNAKHQTSVHGSSLVAVKNVQNEILGPDYRNLDKEEQARRQAAVKLAEGYGKGQAN